MESESDLGGRKVQGVHGYCFYGDKLVIVYAGKKDSWTPPGGGVEPGETAEQATIREVHEESNMKVLKHAFIGYQEIYEGDEVKIQTRSVCTVEPYGEFVKDLGDDDITEIRLIDPADYKKYFDWKEIGDHIMQRALEMKKKL